MIDDDQDDIYATQRRLSDSNISNKFVSETDPDKLFLKLDSMELWEDGKPNVIILLDLNMPGTSGYDVLKRLKEHETYSRIPVLMLCKSDDIVDMLESFEFGADGYLVKPVVPSEMLAVVNDLGSVKLQMVH